MSKISEKVLFEIEKNSVEPRGRVYFTVRELVFWLFTGVFLVLASLLFSAIIYKIFEGRFSDKVSFIDQILRDIFYVVPYFWFFVLIGLSLFGFYNYRCTRNSYKHRKRYVLIASGAIILILGIILYVVDIGRIMNNVLSYSNSWIYA